MKKDIKICFFKIKVVSLSYHKVDDLDHKGLNPLGIRLRPS
jgi:hypothetical protein